jgi:hypothetical protein
MNQLLSFPDRSPLTVSAIFVVLGVGLLSAALAMALI